MTRIPALVTALVAGAIASTVAAHEDARGHAPHATVRLQDLKLDTEEGARRLARRIDAAADYVCGGQPTSAAESGANADYKACRQETIAAALKSAAPPMLARVVEGRRLLRLAAQ